MSNIKKKIEEAKPYIQLVVTGLVELFTEAVCTNVMTHVSGNRFAKFGARLGAGAIGLMIGDQVTDYLCDSAGDFLDGLEEYKTAIENEKGEVK